jgi:hypothetical protein
MEQDAATGVPLPVGFCTLCEREVLTSLGVDDDDPRCCVHCDTPIDEEMLRLSTATDLERVGYAEIEPARSCGSGGCGSGGCRR